MKNNNNSIINKKVLKAVASVTSTDETRKTLANVKVTKNGKTVLEATDGYRLIRVEQDNETANTKDTRDFAALVNGKALSAVPDVPVSSLSFENEKITINNLSLDVYDGTFPATDQVIPKDKEDDIILTFNPDLLGETLISLSKTLGDYRGKTVFIRVPKKYPGLSPIKISGENSEGVKSLAVVMPVRA